MKPKDSPDEVFEAPGFKIVRRGRFLELKTHRSPEEHRELRRRMHESRPQILADIESKTTQLLEIIHKYSSLDLVANLFLKEIFHDPNEYKESDSKLRPHWVEHATVLELSDTRYELRPPVLVDAADIERAHALLDEIFTQTTFYYLAESADPSVSGPPSRLDELRFTTLLHGMNVRSPAYSSHWRDVLRGLFGGGSAVQCLSDTHKLDVQSALKIIEAIEEHIVGALQDRVDKAHVAHEDVSERLKAYKSSGVFNGQPHEKEVFDRIRNMRGKQAKRYIKYVLVEWTRVALGTVLSFSVDAIAKSSGIDPERVQAFLDQTCLEFGISLKDALPAPVNVLHEKPIVRYEGGYFCSVPHLLPWSVKPAFERVLASSPNWNAYQKHRSTYLVSSAIKYLKDAMPRAVEFQNLFYPIGPGQEAELDGLVLFDRYAFLVEGKAGSFGKGRRGGKEKIKTQLEALVGDAADQVTRADNYIRSTDVPTFRVEGGGTITLDKAKYSERVLLTITLDVLDIFTADMYQMRDIGVVTTHDLPWCVALTDLRAISEILLRPVEFTHYLRWRMSTIADSRLHGGKDELNWLAVYLKEGPARPSVPGDFTDLSFTSYTDDFDAFFLYREGARTIPAPRPTQPVPRPLDALLDRLTEEGTPKFTELGEHLLDMNFDDRRHFAQCLIEFEFNQRRDRADNFVFQTDSLAVRVVAGNPPKPEMESEAAKLSKSSSKPALVISVMPVSGWYVRTWVVSA